MEWHLKKKVSQSDHANLEKKIPDHKILQQMKINNQNTTLFKKNSIQQKQRNTDLQDEHHSTNIKIRFRNLII